MCLAPALWTAPFLKTCPVDQRLHQRYPIKLELERKLLNKCRAQRLRSGRMLYLCRAGVPFEANDWLPVRRPIELSVNWPFFSEGICRLRLVLCEHDVRSDRRAIAVSTDRHEFRTAGAPPLSIRSSRKKCGA